MSERAMPSQDEALAEYVRASMRVAVPDTLVAEIMRSAAETPQVSRPWFLAFGPLIPAAAAVAVTAIVVAVGFLVTAPRDIGPAPDATEAAPTATVAPTPAPTITPEEARILTEPGDVIVVPAFDGNGQFGTIRIERGEERGEYADYIPMEAMQYFDVFFVEVHVTYEVDRPTTEPYGNIDFGFAVDGDGDGLDDDDVINQHLGYSWDGLEMDAGPAPLLPFTQDGPGDMSGWISLALPAAGADYEIYLVQISQDAGAPPAQYVPLEAATSALLRVPGEPAGVTSFDWDNPPPELASAPPMPNLQRLPTPAPSPATSLEPVAEGDLEAAAAAAAASASLMVEPQTCINTELGVTISFPSAWHTNEAFEDMPACSLFAPEPIDAELVYYGLTNDRPPITMFLSESWVGGATDQPNVPQAQFARVPMGERVAWVISYAEAPGVTYLVSLTDDPYGPFLRTGHGDDALVRALVNRMLELLAFDE